MTQYVCDMTLRLADLSALLRLPFRSFNDLKETPVKQECSMKSQTKHLRTGTD